MRSYLLPFLIFVLLAPAAMGTCVFLIFALTGDGSVDWAFVGIAVAFTAFVGLFEALVDVQDAHEARMRASRTR